MRVLASIDPGLTTGVCLINLNDLDNPLPIEDGELTLEEYYDWLEDKCQTYGHDLCIVIESFIITAQTAKLSQAPWSLENIGVARFLARKYEVPLSLQKPSEKPFASNERLRKVGFWSVGTDGHSVDAYRHAMIWIANRHPSWTKKLIL